MSFIDRLTRALKGSPTPALPSTMDEMAAEVIRAREKIYMFATVEPLITAHFDDLVMDTAEDCSALDEVRLVWRRAVTFIYDGDI